MDWETVRTICGVADKGGRLLIAFRRWAAGVKEQEIQRARNETFWATLILSRRWAAGVKEQEIQRARNETFWATLILVGILAFAIFVVRGLPRAMPG